MSGIEGRLLGEHILLAAEYLHFGGTRTYLLRLLDLYFRAGARVTLVTTLPDDDPDMQGFMGEHGGTLLTFGEVMRRAGYRGTDGHPTVWSTRQWWRERKAFAKLAQDVDATRVVVSVGTPGLLLSAASALPDSIVIAHGYPHGRRQELLGRLFLSRLIPQRTRFISMSDFERREIHRLWNLQWSESTVSTVLSTDGELVENDSTGQPPWTVLTASLVEPYKRPFDWIKVAELVINDLPPDSVDFVWLGEGSQLDEARACAASSSATHHIHFPGLSKDPEADYKHARLYLQLSTIENLSLSTLDAQRHGIPCIVTDTGGFPEIVQDGLNGFVVSPGDVGGAARAVKALLSDHQLWSTQSQESAQRYVERHSPDAWQRQIIAAHLPEL